MTIRARVLVPVLVALGAAFGCSTPPTSGGSSSSGAPSPTPPAQQQQQQGLTPLTRSVHPLARPEFDLGRRDPSVVTAGSIYFKPSAAQRANRDALLDAVQNPASPSYHKWLTVEEYAARFGAQAADIGRVSSWLKQQGLAIDRVGRLGTRIGFRGTGGQVEAAFHTEIHNYDLGGVTHYAMASAPLIPSELAPAVLGLRGFHDFPVPSPEDAPRGASPVRSIRSTARPRSARATSQRSTTPRRSPPRERRERASTSSSSGRRTSIPQTSRASGATSASRASMKSTSSSRTRAHPR